MPICQHVKITYGLTVPRLEGLDRREMLPPFSPCFFFFPPTRKYRAMNSLYWENKGLMRALAPVVWGKGVMNTEGALMGEGLEEGVSVWERQPLS